MKPSIPRGTRDFGPGEMQKRQYILNVIRRNFELFGYQPIETPAMENITTLTGKYGEEGDQLIFKILNSRIHESKNKEALRKEFDLSLESSRNSEELTEKALRYDLTVPFARFVVMNQHNLTFPFKRYQIQPVWRADRPQKGRYREFYQCDADVIGSDSLINELELISMIDKSFSELNVSVLTKYNNRKILTGIADYCGCPEKLIDITVAIDKLDKIGEVGVKNELSQKGIPLEKIEAIFSCIFPKDDISYDFDLLIEFDVDKGLANDLLEAQKGIYKKDVSKIGCLMGYFKECSSDAGITGCIEAFTVFAFFSKLNLKTSKLEFDSTIARGLNYYTGAIFEVKANAGTFTPSILGGGRYDDLTGIFGLKNMSGVGISFGVDRIYDVMEELNLFPDQVTKSSGVKLLFTHFDADTQNHCLSLAAQLRQHNIACEIYPDLTKKLGKQFDYANKKNIAFVCTVGGNEISSGEYAFKNMATGEQEKLTLIQIIERLKHN